MTVARTARARRPITAVSSIPTRQAVTDQRPLPPGFFKGVRYLHDATLAGFIIGLSLVERYAFLANVNRALGVILVLFGLHFFWRRQGTLSWELVLAALFVIWSTVTGMLGAADPDWVWRFTRLMVQNIALLFAVIEYVIDRRHPSLVFIFLLLLVPILGAYSYETGEVAAATSGFSRGDSFLNNPNTLGYHGLYGVFAVAYFWRTDAGRLRWLTLAALPIAIGIIVISGSRKSFLVLNLYAAVWLLICQRRFLFGRIGHFVAAIAVIGALYSTGTFVMNSTLLGSRLRDSMNDPHIDSSRYDLYARGWELFIERPITGVGLGNYYVVSGTGQYTHSDYVEVLATTGAIGFVLYFGALVLLLRRLRRVGMRTREGPDRYYPGFYVSVLLAFLALGIGGPNFLSPPFWIIVGSMIGHSTVVGRRAVRT